mmetsp:Transcript_23049/g.34318  ORF Transcript_23049/g.34318 Transcript_23049/m.34318 type:complete len:249 (-) Transcript_23049:122-868(-)
MAKNIEETPLDPEANEGEEDIKISMPAPAVKEGGGMERTCCSLTLDIIGLVFLYIMGIFFLIGGLIAHPLRLYYLQQKLDEPYVFFFLAAVCYLTTTIIDVVQRRHKGPLEISMGSIAIGGGLMWFISSIFLFRRIQKVRVYGGMFIVGCVLNLVTITFDMCMVFLKHTNKPFFRAIALKLAWIANILLIGGAVAYLRGYDSDVQAYCSYEGSSHVLASGAAIYIIHAVFHTLSIFLGGITFTVSRSR